MKNKYKITGFSRLLIFMIFFTPIAYIGASYYNGEDGIEKLKSFFDKSEDSSISDQIEDKKNEISNLEQKLEVLNQELRRLERKK